MFRGENGSGDDARLPITRKTATLRFDLLGSAQFFVPPRSKRSALATHIHRLQAMAEWKAVAMVS